MAEDDGSRGDGGPVGVTFRQAASVSFDTTPNQLLRRFRGRPYATRPGPSRDLNCYVYVVSDRPETAWSFCFRKNRLRSSSTSPL